MDNLRHRIGLTYVQMAELMDWGDNQYRVVRHKVFNDYRGSLTHSIDIKVRHAISILILGLKADLLPLEHGEDGNTLNAQICALDELIQLYAKRLKGLRLSNDPTGYKVSCQVRSDQFIHGDVLASHALRFAAWDSSC